MATPVKLPPIATDTTDGTLVRWLVEVGETVTPGQVIAEVDTAKVVFEVEATVAGTVIGLVPAVGDEVAVGDTLAWIGDPGDRVPSFETDDPSVAQPATQRRASTGEPRAAPVVRRLAERLGVDVALVVGSGSGGRILREDVERFAATEIPAGSRLGGRAERMRLAIAAAMSRAKREVPHFYASLEVDTSSRDGEIEQHGFTPVLLGCVARTLAGAPALNAVYDDARGPVRAGSVNLGVAVATPDGLVVPVLHRAESLGFQDLAARLDELVEKARRGRLEPADVDGVTFTVSNAGMAGVDSIVPIVHQPAIAILGVGARGLRPVVVGGAVTARPTVQLVLACDHRAVDGLEASEWLAQLGRELGGDA